MTAAGGQMIGIARATLLLLFACLTWIGPLAAETPAPVRTVMRAAGFMRAASCSSMMVTLSS